jgi:hypothetical protein
MKQDGNENLSDTDQVGDNNYAKTTQLENLSESFITQTGDGNSATVRQYANDSNMSDVDQIGDNNKANVDQFGGNNMSTILSTGNGNINVVDQGDQSISNQARSFDSNSTIIQLGNMNKGTVLQLGNSQISNVNQMGNMNTANVTQGN